MRGSPLNPGMAQLAAAGRDLNAVLDHALVSKAFPYLFFYLPKCACTTLKTLLWKAELRAGGACSEPTSFADVHLEQESPRSPWVRHQDALVSRVTEGEENLFSFSLVRNPYARAYSAYKWLAVEGTTDTRKNYLSRLGWLGRRPPSFEAFLELVRSQHEREMDHHWAPITSIIPMADITFDFVGCVEHLSDDMPKVMERIFGDAEHFDPKIHMYRSSRGTWEDTLQCISPSARAMVRDIYRADFDAFGYSEDPEQLEPDRDRLVGLSTGGGVSENLRLAARLRRARDNGPDTPTLEILSRRFPKADLVGFRGLILRNAEMPEWWTAGGSQLWTLPGAPLPRIEVHIGKAIPTHALVALACAPQPDLILWGDGSIVAVGPDSSMPTSLFVCQGGSAIYVGACTATSGNAMIDARNGATVFVVGDQLWFPDVRISTDGLHAIRDRSTGERLNPYGGDINIGEHVWLKTGVTVHGGATLGDDIIVEERSIVESSLPHHTFCGGSPARVVRANVTWCRENEP